MKSTTASTKRLGTRYAIVAIGLALASDSTGATRDSAAKVVAATDDGPHYFMSETTRNGEPTGNIDFKTPPVTFERPLIRFLGYETPKDYDNPMHGACAGYRPNQSSQGSDKGGTYTQIGAPVTEKLYEATKQVPPLKRLKDYHNDAGIQTELIKVIQDENLKIQSAPESRTPGLDHDNDPAPIVPAKTFDKRQPLYYVEVRMETRGEKQKDETWSLSGTAHMQLMRLDPGSKTWRPALDASPSGRAQEVVIDLSGNPAGGRKAKSQLDQMKAGILALFEQLHGETERKIETESREKAKAAAAAEAKRREESAATSLEGFGLPPSSVEVESANSKLAP